MPEVSPDEVRVIAARFSTLPIKSISRVTDGSINVTYEVTKDDNSVFILQGMSSIFTPAILGNLIAIEPIMKDEEVPIPNCIAADDGELFIEAHNRWYRALTFIEGVTRHDHIPIKAAKSAGKLIGEFHSALANQDLKIVEPISHFHDTAYYFERLDRVLEVHKNDEKNDTLTPIAKRIKEEYQKNKNGRHELPIRVIHGDLKISNIRFDDNNQAVGIIDLDTLMEGTIATDMGDALRSWCGSAGEDESKQIFDLDVYEKALEGYSSTAKDITEEEIASIPQGIKLMTIELAARFLMDAYEETYFALLHSKYDSLYEQNKTRAENQLRFLEAFEKEELV